MRDFIYVSADFLAQIGQDIRVTDFQREERIGGVLDQFGAIDRGDQQRRVGGSRAAVLVNRACELVFQNRPIDFAHLGGRSLVFDTYYDAVRVKEIFDGGAFAQELRIGDNVEGDSTAARIGIEGATQLKAGASRNG